MLKGTREGIIKKIQPISVHGQLSCDVYFTDADDPNGPVHTARLGAEAIPSGLDPGDRIRAEYLVGQVVRITRVA